MHNAAVCCYLQVVVLLLHAQGLCNMSLQPERHSLQVSWTVLTHLNRCTDVYWYALHLVQVRTAVAAISAGCCAVAACTGFVQHVTAAGQVQPARSPLTDLTHLNQTRMSTGYALRRVGHACPVTAIPLPSAGCCAEGSMQGLCSISTEEPVTGCRVCF
jgi:hypothetical protein